MLLLGENPPVFLQQNKKNGNLFDTNEKTTLIKNSRYMLIKINGQISLQNLKVTLGPNQI